MKTVTVLRKPLEGTVAQNCLEHGTGTLNIDGCRVATGEEDAQGLARWNKEGDNGWKNSSGGANAAALRKENGQTPLGRWPSNVILHERVAAQLDEQSGVLKAGIAGSKSRVFGNGIIYGTSDRKLDSESTGYGDTGGASRFFKQVKE